MTIPDSEPAQQPVTQQPQQQSNGPRILVIVLVILGILAVILGCLYIFSGSSLPGWVQGRSHTGHHVFRATGSFVIAAVLFLAAWFVNRRRPR